MFRRQRTSRYYPRAYYRQQDRRAQYAPARRRRRRGLSKLLGEFVSWFLFLALLSGGAVGGIFYLLHTRFDDLVRRHVEARFRAAYPQHRVVIQSARRIEGQGIELRGLSVAEKTEGGATAAVFQVDELLLQCNAAMEELVAGNVCARQLVLRRIKFTAQQAEDGTWNLQQLLPLPRLGTQPIPIVVEQASGEIRLAGQTSGEALNVTIPRLCLVPPGALAESTAGNAAQPSPAPASPGVPAATVAAATSRPAATTWTMDGILTSPFVQQLAIRGEFDQATGIWRMEGDVRGLHGTRERMVHLPDTCRAYANLCDNWELAVHARFNATNQQAEGRWCRFSVQGELEGRIEDKRLPFPLSDLKGKFQSDGRSLRLDDVSARAGSATLSGQCSIGGFFEDAPCSLQLSVRQFSVDRDLVGLLPEAGRLMWDKISPQGLINAEVGLVFDGRTVRHEADITCHDVSFAYHKFPYRLANATGKVEWRNGVLRFDNFTAFANGKPVKIEGEIENPGPDYTGFVRVLAEEPVRIDERLIAALPESARRIVNQLQPQGGLVTAAARFERYGTSPPVATKYVKISLQDCAANYAPFPYPLSKIRGNVVMQDDRWTIEGMEGFNDSARVLCSGGWGRDENGVVQLSLKFNADDVPLEDELRNALRPAAQSVWNNLQPRGTIDELNASVRFDSETRKTSVEVIATKRPPDGNVPGRTISIKPTWLPYQFEEVEGTLHFRDGVTRLTGIRGHHGDALLLLNGEASHTPDGNWRVSADQLEADRLEVTPDLLAALPRRLGAALGRLNLSGPISLHGSLALEGKSGNPAPDSSQWDLEFDVEGGSLNCGIRLDRVHGGLKLNGVQNAQGLASRGWLNIDSLMYEGIQCTKVQGPLSLDDERLGFGEWVTPHPEAARPGNICARVFGGDLRANGEVLLSGDFPFRLESGLFHADLATISRETTSRRPDLSGETQVNLQLAGNSKGKHTLHGAGNVQLTNADIYQLPVLVDMLKLLKVKPPDGTAFTSSDARYRIEGDRIYFDEIVFNGDVIRLDGKGDMTLDRSLNLIFHTSLASNDLSDRILQPFLKEVGKQVFEIRVTGNVDNPVVNKEALRNFRENIESIFPGSNPSGTPVMSRLPSPTDVLNGVVPTR